MCDFSISTHHSVPPRSRFSRPIGRVSLLMGRFLLRTLQQPSVGLKHLGRSLKSRTPPDAPRSPGLSLRLPTAPGALRYLGMSLRYRLHLVGLKSLGRNWKFPRHRVGLRLPGPNSKPRTLQPYRDALKSLGQSWKFLLAPGALKSLGSRWRRRLALGVLRFPGPNSRLVVFAEPKSLGWSCRFRAWVHCTRTTVWACVWATAC